MESIDTYDMYKQSLTHPYTMIKATRSWCGPCKKVHPQVVELVRIKNIIVSTFTNTILILLMIVPYKNILELFRLSYSLKKIN